MCGSGKVWVCCMDHTAPGFNSQNIICAYSFMHKFYIYQHIFKNFLCVIPALHSAVMYFSPSSSDTRYSRRAKFWRSWGCWFQVGWYIAIRRNWGSHSGWSSVHGNNRSRTSSSGSYWWCPSNGRDGWSRNWRPNVIIEFYTLVWIMECSKNISFKLSIMLFLL